MVSMQFEPWRNRDAMAKVVFAEYDRGNTAGILCSAGIFKEPMGSENRGGIGLSYRPASLHRLAEIIPWN